jgi:hypothetical protein
VKLKANFTRFQEFFGGISWRPDGVASTRTEQASEAAAEDRRQFAAALFRKEARMVAS